jgi:hypothetical protein
MLWAEFAGFQVNRDARCKELASTQLATQAPGVHDERKQSLLLCNASCVAHGESSRFLTVTKSSVTVAQSGKRVLRADQHHHHHHHCSSMSEPQQNAQMSYKSRRVNTINPLREAGILQQTLGYVGPGHFLYAALVSKAWHRAYLRVPEHHMLSCHVSSSGKAILCLPQMTLHSAAVTSLDRFRLARDAGVNLASLDLQFAVGKYGSIATILAAEAALSDSGAHFWAFVVIGALHSCHLSTLQWLVEDLGHPLPEMAAELAARGGCIDNIAWLQQRGAVLSADTMRIAARGGHWHTVQYLRNEGVEWGNDVCTFAADGGRLKLLQQLHEQGCPWEADVIGDVAAASGSVPMLQWLKAQDIVFTAATMFNAASNGHTAACKHLRFTEQCDWNIDACMAAALNSHLDTLKWLQEHGCPCEFQRVCVAAAHGGCTAIMAHMLQQQQVVELPAAEHAVLLTLMLNTAGIHERLAAAQWVHAQGAQWPAVLHFATNEQQQWHEAVLEWARAQGCTSPLL